MMMAWQGQIDRIEQRQAEVRAFSEGQRALSERNNRTLWIFPAFGMVAGATLFGGGMVFATLLT